jgi:hypothetical protein
MAEGYEHDLAEYLKWAHSLPNLDEPTREKIRQAAENLRRVPLCAGFVREITDAP